MSTKSGSLSIACVQLGPRKLTVIRSSGVSAVQGCLNIEVNGRTVGTSRIVLYHGCMGVRFSGVSVKRGSTVQMSKLLIENEACTPNLRTPTRFDCKNCLLLCK